MSTTELEKVVRENDVDDPLFWHIAGNGDTYALCGWPLKYPDSIRPFQSTDEICCHVCVDLWNGLPL